MHRTWGGVIAGALFVLPSLVLLIALSWLYLAYGDVPAVAGILYGIKPAVVAIVLHAAWRIGTRALKRPVLWVIAAARVHRHFRVRGAVSDDRSLGGAHRLRRRARRAEGIRDGSEPWRRRRKACARRRSTTTRRRRARAMFRWSRARGSDPGVPRPVDTGARRPGARVRRRYAAAADGPVLQQGRAPDLRRRVRGAAVRLPGRRRDLRVAHPGADDRRAGARRDHPRPAHHDRRVRRLRRQLDEGGIRSGVAGAGRYRRRRRGDVLHVPAELPVHPRRRAAGRDDARPAALHGAADGHHCRRRRRDRQPGAVLRLACPVAGRLARRYGCGRARSRYRWRSASLQASRCSGSRRT